MSLYRKQTLNEMQKKRDFVTEQFLLTKDQNKRKALNMELDLINSAIIRLYKDGV